MSNAAWMNPDEQLSPVEANTWRPLPGASATPLPAFPVDVLPRDVRAWVRAEAHASQTPADLAALLALAVLAAVVQGAGVVDCGNWTEELVLYHVLAMPSGERKTPTWKAATGPLRDIEKNLKAEAKPRVAAQAQERKMREARLKVLGDRAAKEHDGAKRTALEEEAGDLAAALDALPALIEPRLLADDTTPEALAGLLARHGCMAIIPDESAFLSNILGRYSEGNPNLSLVCSAYSGAPTSVDRRGRDPEYLDRPLLTMALTVQPHVLQALVSHQGARDQGLVARCVLVQPSSIVGEREIEPEPVPDNIREAWTAVVNKVADLRRTDATDTTPVAASRSAGCVGSIGSSHGFTLTLDADAHELLTDLRRELEPRLGPDGDLHSMADWGNKHAGRVARMAALLHLTEHAITEPISAATMDAAIAIGDYALVHAHAVLTGPPSTIMDAVAWLKRHRKSTVSVTELHKGPLYGHGKAHVAAQLAADLVAHGYLRPLEPAPAGKQGGRPPSPSYAVHPDLGRTGTVASDDEESF